MAKEIGRVTSVRNGWMDVKVPTGTGCSACLGKSSCTFSGPESAYRHFRIPVESGAEEGSRITLEISEAAGNLSALVLFGSPIPLFLMSYLVIGGLFGLSHAGAWSAVSTIVLYVIELPIVNRWLSGLSMYRPRVVKIEARHEAPPI